MMQDENGHSSNPNQQSAYYAPPQQPASYQNAQMNGSAYGAPVPPKKQRGVWGILIAIVVLLVFIASAVVTCTSSIDNAKSGKTSYAANTIAVITVSGTIGYDGTECSPEGLKSLLDEAEGNSNIRGVVLRVNSGGGTATAGEEMATYVNDFSKPIVVSCAATNASAAYEFSSQADYIYAAKTSDVGAIGTAMEMVDLSGLMEKLGISMNSITSSNSKDSSYGTRALTADEQAYYQNMINEVNEVFIQNVASGRAMSTESVRVLATGMPFTGTQGVNNGLVDEIGTCEDACAKAAELAGCKNNYTVDDLQLPSDSLSSLTSLLSSQNESSSTDVLISALKELGANGTKTK